MYLVENSSTYLWEVSRKQNSMQVYNILEARSLYG